MHLYLPKNSIIPTGVHSVTQWVERSQHSFYSCGKIRIFLRGVNIVGTECNRERVIKLEIFRSDLSSRGCSDKYCRVGEPREQRVTNTLFNHLSFFSFYNLTESALWFDRWSRNAFLFFKALPTIIVSFLHWIQVAILCFISIF